MKSRLLGIVYACLAAITFSGLAQAGPITSSVAGFVRQEAGLPSGTNPTSIEVAYHYGNSYMIDHGIVEFDISSILSPVAGATLELFRDSTIGQDAQNIPFDIEVYGYVGDGNLAVGDFGVGASIGSFIYTNQAVEFDVTPFLNTLVGSESFVGFNLRRGTPDLSAIARFDGLAENSPPLLQVSSVPIPPALYLFGSGLIGLIGVARRKAC